MSNLWSIRYKGLPIDNRQDGHPLAYSDSPVPIAGHTYIETGCGEGGSIETALRLGFEKIYAIELDREKIDFCLRRFGDPPKIVWVFAPSVAAIFEVYDPHYKTVFWLDAHYTGGGRPRILDDRYGDCPLIGELQAILQMWLLAEGECWRPTILIDDLPMFTNYWEGDCVDPSFRRDEWPTLNEIVQAVTMIWGDYQAMTMGTILYLYPPEAVEEPSCQ